MPEDVGHASLLNLTTVNRLKTVVQKFDNYESFIQLRGPEWTLVDPRGPEWTWVDVSGPEETQVDSSGPKRNKVDQSGPKQT